MGEGRDEEVQWSYYDAMNKMLGHKPSTVPESVVDSLALTHSKKTTCESSEVQEVNEVNETLFCEDSNPDETVPIESAKPPDDTSLQTKKGSSSTKRSVQEEISSK